MRVYAAADVHAALPWPALAQALHAVFTARGGDAPQVPLRHAHALGGADTLLLMPAWDSQLVLTKLVTVMPGAAHTVQATVLALDRATGRPLAVLDGEAITLRRTAATSALAARHLARPGASTLLLVGTGRLAAWMARAHAALLPGITRVQVWGRRTDAARSLAATLRAEGLPAEAVADLQAAVHSADIVCCATTALEPLVQGAWLQPGTHVDLVGAFRPQMREVDSAAVQRARVVVDTLAGALAEAGELVQAIAAGAITPAHVLGELGSVLAGTLAGRTCRDDITLFKSVGSARADLAAARCVLQAQPVGAGTGCENPRP
jgi:ornithine cyclodeaminase